MSVVNQSSVANAASSSNRTDCSNQTDVLVDQGVINVALLKLHFGLQLKDARIAWRITGNKSLPVVIALGGISAGREVFATNANEVGWWKGIVGPGLALDSNRYRILGIDFVGGSGESTGPVKGQSDFPSVSAYDQAQALVHVLDHLSIESVKAIVGSSYGGMVALAFAEQYPKRAEKIVVISAADKPHPMATAWRSVQRTTVKTMAAYGAAAEGLKLARALAMTTYRSFPEFKQRFDAPAERRDGSFRFPVEDYLYSRGQAYADSYVPESFVCLSESIDLHRVDATKINVPTYLVAVREDQLVPIDDMRELAARLSGPKQLFELSSLYGHDAFLKEATALKDIFAKVLA
jgi:homoserine O-acetyltransferase/O-succinyltransferase